MDAYKNRSRSKRASLLTLLQAAKAWRHTGDKANYDTSIPRLTGFSEDAASRLVMILVAEHVLTFKIRSNRRSNNAYIQPGPAAARLRASRLPLSAPAKLASLTG